MLLLLLLVRLWLWLWLCMLVAVVVVLVVCCSSPRITAGCLAVQTGLGALTLEARNGSPSAKLKGLSSYRAIAAPRVESCCDLPGPNSRASV